MSKLLQGFFVTGTDTGVGKTYISRLLADSIATYRQVTYVKPVQSGCVIGPDSNLKAPDFDFVMSGKSVMIGSYEQHVSYRFLPACSPHLAASRSGENISFDKIKNDIFYVASKKAFTIVEGAGGLMTPLSDNTFIVDLISYLKLGTIVVTRPSLGTLNHTFLTLRVLKANAIPLLGVIVNCHENFNQDYIYFDNIRLIQDHIYPQPLLEVPYGAGVDEQSIEFCTKITSLL